MNTKIAIQGIRGCFHDAAAHEFFASQFPGIKLDICEFDSFHNLFNKLESDASLMGIVAIENTIAGPLLQNHEFLRKSSLTIVGEHKMRISHVLCGMPGQNIDDIREVHSHPMALMQCEEFLRSHNRLKMVEDFDTAGAAKKIADENLMGFGAICGQYAADLYGLTTFASGVETNKRNFTRFLILADPLIASEFKPRADQLNKASVAFTLPHSQGALSKVLTILSFYDINLSKIQSIPIIGREWEYRFYIDLTFDSYARYQNAITAVRPLISDFKTLGEYKEFNNEIH